MLDNRKFWVGNMLLLCLLYLGGAVLALQGQHDHLLVKLDVIILAFHFLEIPLAFIQLKARNPQPLRLMAMTFVFGLVWWVPAKRGLFAVR